MREKKYMFFFLACLLSVYPLPEVKIKVFGQRANTMQPDVLSLAQLTLIRRCPQKISQVTALITEEVLSCIQHVRTDTTDHNSKLRWQYGCVML